MFVRDRKRYVLTSFEGPNGHAGHDVRLAGLCSGRCRLSRDHLRTVYHADAF